MVALLLFDIDGTILKTGRAGRTAMDMAFERILGVPGALAEASLGGRTDLEIVGTILRRYRQELPSTAHEEYRQAIFAAYLEALPTCLMQSEGYQILDGVRETLLWLREESDYILGLGTGNMQQGAMLKLRHDGLDEFFDVGGYGDDHAERPLLLKRGWARARERYGRPASAADVLVIGDTLRDIEAAREAGMKVAAVSTGGVSYEVLAAANPDLLWRSMWEGLAWMKQTKPKMT